MVRLLFTFLILASCAYAFVAGGRDGKWASTMFIAAALLSIPASRLDPSWTHTEMPVFLVDTLLLIGLFWLALRSRSYWPIWVTSFQLVTVATHVTTMFMPSWRPGIYIAMQTFWSPLILLVMAFGIMLDRRSRD